MARPSRSRKAKPTTLVNQSRRATFSYVPSLASFLSYVENQTPHSPTTRLQALSVPAMLRGRNLICSIATLPLDVFNQDNELVQSSLFSQFDPDVPNVVHLAQTLEDLICDGVAWWEITSFGWDGFPNSVRRVDPGLVNIYQPASPRSMSPLPSGIDPRRTYPDSTNPVIWIDGREVQWSNIIRFDSPNPGVLIYGSQVIRRAVMLDQAAKMYAQNPDAAEIMRVPDEYDEDQAKLFATNYVSAKRTRSTVNLPVDVMVERPTSANPAQIQLVELQKQASIEIANLLGLDPEDLGVSTTSRTYQNAVDRRRDRINDVLAPYMRAITDRLSMADITKRGQVAGFDLDDYLKANAAERWANYKLAAELGVLSADEIRKIEKIPGPAPKNATPPTVATEKVDPGVAPTPAQEPAVAQNADRPAYTFSRAKHTFVDLPLEKFSVDSATRTITGVSLPYGKSAHGMRFEQGSLQFDNLSHVKLLRDHDPLQLLGVATAFKDSNSGVTMAFKVARGPDGDAALALAEDGVLDGLSVGVDFSDGDVTPDPRFKNSVLVKRADLREVSLTGMPAFSDARVTTVKASEAEMASEVPTPMKEAAMTAPTGPVPFAAEGMITINPTSEADEPEDDGVASAPASATASAAPAVTFSRPVVNPTRTVVTAQVREAPVYRFNRNGALVAGSHDLAADLFAWDKMHDVGAYNRALGFMRAQFNDDPTISTDVNELNPTIYQKRYIDERDYATPLWARMGRGAAPNGIQPFSWPMFASSAIEVTTHVEGTDPDSLDYITTSQTVTPTAKNARVQLSREIWDMGGTPGISDLVWRKVVRAWNEAREAVIDAALDAYESSPGIVDLGTFTAGADGQTLGGLLEAGLAQLNFARGGFRFEFVATQADLFGALAAAVDDTGRPLYPMNGPVNTNGSLASRFASLNVGGVEFVPNIAGDAAGQTSAVNSFLLDPTAVDAWATEPQRIDLTHSLSYIDIGVWGYMAAAVNDVNGVRTISWDPTA